ncbi:DUF4405 domain-containing protein [archaeon]|nr:DUF4405 domain-containing protein [archaeon]
MNKAKLHYIIDVILLLVFIITALTGLIMFFFLTGGIKHSWSIIHKWAGIIMVLIALIHIILHWKWLTNITKNSFSNK